MMEPLVTIGGQRVSGKGQAPPTRPDARDASGRPLVRYQMAPQTLASRSNEETLEAGLPFLGAFVAVILFTIVVLVLAKRSR